MCDRKAAAWLLRVQDDSALDGHPIGRGKVLWIDAVARGHLARISTVMKAVLPVGRRSIHDDAVQRPRRLAHNLAAGNPWEIAGGTSLSAPSWAALSDACRTSPLRVGSLGTQHRLSRDSAMYHLPLLAFAIDVATICHVPPFRDHKCRL